MNINVMNQKIERIIFSAPIVNPFLPGMSRVDVMIIMKPPKPFSLLCFLL